jgi:hypothetical protein
MTETQRHDPHAAPAGEARRRPTPPQQEITGVREADLEPYIGLRYLSKLFKLMAVVLILLLVAEAATGFMQQGTAAIPTLIAEASRLIVFAGLLWGAGDLAILLIDTGHDVRATRILIARQLAHHMTAHHDARGDDGGEV